MTSQEAHHGKKTFAPYLSTPTLTYEYEVFVSFHVEDTHKSFTNHLFTALDRKGIHVYKSEFIWTELMKAIETSRFAVVVFSKNYTTSLKLILNLTVDLVSIVLTTSLAIDLKNISPMVSNGFATSSTIQNNTLILFVV
ncbi:hypothetical protein ACB092_10G061900 [Castanea dentata]